MKTKMKGRTGLGGDLVRLTYIGWNEETVERANGPIGLVILQRSTHTGVSTAFFTGQEEKPNVHINPFHSRAPVTKLHRLPIRLIPHPLRLQTRQEAILPARKRRMHARRTSLRPFIRIIICYYVFERADVGVRELGEVCFDVVVEVDFDDCEFGFVGEAAGGAVVPVLRSRNSEFVTWGSCGRVEGETNQSQPSGEMKVL